jgi:DNA-binding response OmpR family regulator
MKKNILLVEYNSDVIDAINSYLHHDLFEISIAGNDTVARALLAKKQFDLAVVATLLPKSHGFTLCKYIKENFSNTAVILMCDKIEDEQYRKEGIDSGACEFLEKPLDEKVFRKKVMEYLGIKEAALFGDGSGDSTNLHVLPTLDQLKKMKEPEKKPERDGFDDIIDEVKKNDDPYEIKLD